MYMLLYVHSKHFAMAWEYKRWTTTAGEHCVYWTMTWISRHHHTKYFKGVKRSTLSVTCMLSRRRLEWLPVNRLSPNRKKKLQCHEPLSIKHPTKKKLIQASLSNWRWHSSLCLWFQCHFSMLLPALLFRTCHSWVKMLWWMSSSA